MSHGLYRIERRGSKARDICECGWATPWSWNHGIKHATKRAERMRSHVIKSWTEKEDEK